MLMGLRQAACVDDTRHGDLVEEDLVELLLVTLEDGAQTFLR